MASSTGTPSASTSTLESIRRTGSKVERPSAKCRRNSVSTRSPQSGALIAAFHSSSDGHSTGLLCRYSRMLGFVLEGRVGVVVPKQIGTPRPSPSGNDHTGKRRDHGCDVLGHES